MLEEKPQPAPVEQMPEPVLDEPIAPVETVVTAAPSDFSEMELAAYRRAEMTERMARERATASANRMKTVFEQTDEKLTISVQDIATAYDALRIDYEQMMQVLATVQGIVNESSLGLKAAADICGEV